MWWQIHGRSGDKSPYANIFLSEKAAVVTLFNKKHNKVSITVGSTENEKRPVNFIFSTDAGSSLIREDFPGERW